jgi:hypothetical protein
MNKKTKPITIMCSAYNAPTTKYMLHLLRMQSNYEDGDEEVYQVVAEKDGIIRDIKLEGTRYELEKLLENISEAICR